jgi:Helix-turn-helix.
MMNEKIRIVLIKRGMSMRDLAKLLGTSPQNLNDKLHRDNFKEADLIKIAAALNCKYTVSFTMNDTGEIV